MRGAQGREKIGEWDGIGSKGAAAGEKKEERIGARARWHSRDKRPLRTTDDQRLLYLA